MKLVLQPQRLDGCRALFSLFLVSVLNVQAHAASGGAEPHYHANRSHTHPLPVQGISHSHRGGVPGVAISSQPAPQAPRTQVAAQGITKNSAKCNPAVSSCNYCASNVQGQFASAASGAISWKNKPWRFTWPNPYPPVSKRPFDIFDGVPLAFGIPNEHVQGFVRTNSTNLPYAGSHSHKKQGGIFLITQKADGKKFLSSLLSAASRHPSGVHALGKYLVYGEGRQLVFLDLNRPHQAAIRLSVPAPKGQKPNFGGGVGLVQKADGSHLLMLSGPGGQDGRPRFHRFYQLITQGNIPKSLKYIGQSGLNHPQQWNRQFAFSENLSLLKECGTNDIYAIHTTGDEKGIKAVSGQGYWRLSKLDFATPVPQIRPLNALTSRQNMSSCNVRASGTVYVNNKNQLEFYCHAYAKDPDGSFMNILGQSTRSNDKFYFRAGIIR